MLPRSACLLPAVLGVAFGSAAARTWNVAPDGSGDAMTIQAGIDSAAVGDTVLVECGTYAEHDLVLGKDIVLASATATADCAVVDALQLGRGVLCDTLGPAAEITGFTFRNGQRTGTCPDDAGTGTYCMGGGMLCVGSAVAVTECAFVGNWADDNGGGVACLFSTPTFTDCEFSDNGAWFGAGLISAFPPGAPVLTGCRFYGNAALGDGGAVTSSTRR